MKWYLSFIFTFLITSKIHRLFKFLAISFSPSVNWLITFSAHFFSYWVSSWLSYLFFFGGGEIIVEEVPHMSIISPFFQKGLCIFQNLNISPSFALDAAVSRPYLSLFTLSVQCRVEVFPFHWLRFICVSHRALCFRILYLKIPSHPKVAKALFCLFSDSACSSIFHFLIFTLLEICNYVSYNPNFFLQYTVSHFTQDYLLSNSLIYAAISILYQW